MSTLREKVSQLLLTIHQRIELASTGKKGGTEGIEIAVGVADIPSCCHCGTRCGQGRRFPLKQSASGSGKVRSKLNRSKSAAAASGAVTSADHTSLRSAGRSLALGRETGERA